MGAIKATEFIINFILILNFNITKQQKIEKKVHLMYNNCSYSSNLVLDLLLKFIKICLNFRCEMKFNKNWKKYLGTF